MKIPSFTNKEVQRIDLRGYKNRKSIIYEQSSPEDRLEVMQKQKVVYL